MILPAPFASLFPPWEKVGVRESDNKIDGLRSQVKGNISSDPPHPNLLPEREKGPITLAEVPFFHPLPPKERVEVRGE